MAADAARGGTVRRWWRRGIAATAVAVTTLGARQSAAVPVLEPPGHRITIDRAGAPPVELYYEEKGAGPPLLLLHGLGESVFTWHEVLPALAASHRVIALDLKGFGRSEKPDDGAYSADDQAALVARFIRDRGLTGLTVIGHSFGGTVALRTALAEGIAGSGRIRRIAVIAAPALPGSTPRYFEAVRAPALPDLALSAMSPDLMARLLLREAMGGAATPSDEEVEGYAAPYRDRAAMQAFLATAREIVGERDVEAVAARYRRISEPVLLVWCRNDPIVPLKAGRRLAKVLPRARLAVIERCHHLPQHERPEALLEALSTVLKP